ncbi:9048_t:CDS:2, partial [Ambispora leptoticha]
MDENQKKITPHKIRNFSIIAHIDHGKSTLADRLLEKTNLKNSNKSFERILDSLSLEQEKGITIKLNAVQLYYPPESSEPYIFNLIDTPGHVDFMYEVSRSLAACEGVILLVDAVKGIQAQTLAYYEIAKKLNLKILPVINKIDLPHAQLETIKNQLIELLNCQGSDICLISAKTGKNIDFLSFQTNESTVGKTHFIGGHKHLCCSYIRSGFAPLNHPFPHLLVPGDNSILTNSIINNPDGGDFFTIPFSDLKFCPSFLKKGSPIQDAFLVKNTNRVKKITEKELGSFQIITFKVLNQKKIKESAPGTYRQELEIEPFSLGIEGLPEISKIIFSFGYGQSLESTPDSLMKTKLYNSDIDNKSDSVLTFSGSNEFDVDKNNNWRSDSNFGRFSINYWLSGGEKEKKNILKIKMKQEPLKALIFDLLYNRYYGVIIYVRIFEGELTKGQKIKFYTNQQKVYQVERVGVKTPKETLKDKLIAGEIDNHISPLEGYQEINPNVYSNLYPSDSSHYKEFKKSLEELQIQDSSLSLEAIDSQLLGPGFRCGFLGLLHREIICERLQKEFNCEIITTPPSITYRVIFSNGEILETNNPQKIPTKDKIKNIEELIINLEITTPQEHLGDISQLCQNKRVHRNFAHGRAKLICESLKKTLNQQTFTVPIQACIGNQVIARETLSALKKNVISRIHGGGSDLTFGYKDCDQMIRGKPYHADIDKKRMRTEITMLKIYLMPATKNKAYDKPNNRT